MKSSGPYCPIDKAEWYKAMLKSTDEYIVSMKDTKPPKNEDLRVKTGFSLYQLSDSNFRSNR